MDRLPRVCALLALVLVVAAGCSSGDSEAAVASLSGDAEVGSDEEAPTELTEEAALEFAQCMRDNGVEDFPDPTVDADGNVSFGIGPGGGGGGGGAPGGGAGGETMAARQTCGELVDGVTFGGGRGRGLANNTEVQDALVAYTDCLRDEGLDVGDLQLGGGGGEGPGAGGAPGGGGGPGGGGPGAGGGQQGQGGAPDPGRFIANALDLDADDPEVAAALEVCQPLLENAFSNFGPGANND